MKRNTKKLSFRRKKKTLRRKTKTYRRRNRKIVKGGENPIPNNYKVSPSFGADGRHTEGATAVDVNSLYELDPDNIPTTLKLLDDKTFFELTTKTGITYKVSKDTLCFKIDDSFYTIPCFLALVPENVRQLWNDEKLKTMIDEKCLLKKK